MTRSSKLKPVELEKNRFYVIPFDATMKSNLIYIDSSGKMNVLSEVQPDAAYETLVNVTNSLLAKVNKKADISANNAVNITQSLAELGKRTVAVNILRDALYRLEEYNMNDTLRVQLNKDTVNPTYLLYKEILNTAKLIAQAEVNAENQKAQAFIADQKQAQEQIETAKLQQMAINPELSKILQASYWEEKGFSYLVEKNIDGAIESFDQAEDIYPTYHSVYEISRYLKNEKSSKAINWDNIYAKILKDYSWGMPQVYNEKLKK